MECCRREWPPVTPRLALPEEHGFAGRTVMLLAAFPSEQYSDLSDARMLALEEAILSLCRAVFEAGGSIALRATWEIAPLVAEIATEYTGPELVRAIFTVPVDEDLAAELERFPGVELVLPPAEFRDDGRGRLPSLSLDRLGPLTAAVVVGDAIQSSHDQDAVRPRVARIEVIGRTGAAA